MPSQFERWLYRGVKLPVGMIAVGLACALLLGVRGDSDADVCEDVIDALGLGDTTFVVCPVPRVLVITLVPGDQDTLVITEDGDTLSWPLDTGMLPPENEWHDSFVFGAVPDSDYLWYWNQQPVSLARSSGAGSLQGRVPAGDVSWRRVQVVL